MARKQQIQIQESIETEDQFNNFLETNSSILSCIEIYSRFAGPSVAMIGTLRKIKLEIGGEKIILAKAECDEIDSLERFRYTSEPTFFFVRNFQVISVIFGADAIALVDTAQQEMNALNSGLSRPGYNFLERHPAEITHREAREKEEAEELARIEAAVASRVAARKRRVCERRSHAVPHLNFILFWPQYHHAHYDLYEKWGSVGVSVLSKETLHITEAVLDELAYESDLDLNAAAAHELMVGESLAICFKLDFGNTDTDFVDLMRTVLYEEQLPPDDNGIAKTPFSKYSSISKPPEQVRVERFEALLQKKRDEKEERQRLREEAKRIAREEEEQRIRDEQQRKDEERIARLQAGIIDTPPEEAVIVKETSAIENEVSADVEEQPANVEEQTAEPEIAQEVEEESEEEAELVFPGLPEGEEEAYIPPGGLLVPGLYSPPNHLARANGLTTLFPNVVAKYAQIESEILPPHVLLMFKADRRKEVMAVVGQFLEHILQIGLFAGNDPYTSEHIAYTVREYDKMKRIPFPQEYLALMVSEEKPLPLLSLSALNPDHVSLDRAAGEAECAAMFPVGYGDNIEVDEISDDAGDGAGDDVVNEAINDVGDEEVNDAGNKAGDDTVNDAGIKAGDDGVNEAGNEAGDDAVNDMGIKAGDDAVNDAGNKAGDDALNDEGNKAGDDVGNNATANSVPNEAPSDPIKDAADNAANDAADEGAMVTRNDTGDDVVNNHKTDEPQGDAVEKDPGVPE